MISNQTEYAIGSQILSEYLGSLFLVMAAISPVILFHQVLEAGIGLAVLADALAVGFILFALIEIFGPISGAHFNPAVSLAMVLGGKIGWRQALIYILAQVAGGLTGTVFSHLMFYHKIPKLIAVSEVTRAGGNYFAEILGTFMLVLVIFLLVHNQSDKLSLVVGMFGWGTVDCDIKHHVCQSTSHCCTDVHLRSSRRKPPLDGAVFILMQIIGAVLAVLVFKAVTQKRGET